MYFADIHVHATLRPFHQKPAKDIWHDFAEGTNPNCGGLGLILGGIANVRKKMATYSQSNFAKALKQETSSENLERAFLEFVEKNEALIRSHGAV